MSDTAKPKSEEDEGNPVADEDLHANLDATLNAYPALRGMVPEGWPRAKKFGITIQRMKEFSAAKEQSRYWHVLNFALCVHAAGSLPDPKAKSFMESILRVLNDFVSLLGQLPGVRKTLAPLWSEGGWNSKEPELWSVLATAFLALTYNANGQKVSGFGTIIGKGLKDSDIAIRRSDGSMLHVDVEAWHATKFDGMDTESARTALRRRAEAKCGKKFVDLLKGEIGVAAIVCMAAGADFEVLTQHAQLVGLMPLDELYKAQFGFIYFVGGVSDREALWLQMLDQKALRQYAVKSGGAGPGSSGAESS